MADDYEVASPKELLEKAFGGDWPTLLGQITSAYFDIAAMAMHDEDQPVDWAEVLAVPVFMALDTIESMKNVKEIAKIDEENKKRLILLIIESVLFAVLFIGSAAGNLVALVPLLPAWYTCSTLWAKPA